MCKEKKDSAKFYKDPLMKSGLRHCCIECQMGDNRKMTRKKSLIMLLWFKKKQKCEDCDETRLEVLDNHHLDPALKDPSLKKSSKSIREMKIGKVIEELQKCCVLCVHCRRIRHHAGRNRDTTSERRKYLNQKKIDVGKCMRCAFWDPEHLYLFDFDHRDPGEKKERVSQLWKHEVIDAEIAKCDLLCAKCHRLKTRDDSLKLSNFTEEEIQKTTAWIDAELQRLSRPIS